MVKWLNRKVGGSGMFEIPSKEGGSYIFDNGEKGTAVPDVVADALLKTGEYVELKTPWHEERKRAKESALLSETLAKLPEEVKKLIPQIDKKGDK